MLDAGCRLKSFYRAGGRSRRRLFEGVPGREARRRRARDPRGSGDQARHRRRHPRRPRADGGARHAARQGRDARQAGRDDARAARRAAARAGRDRAHPLDPLFRALHAARDHRRGRAGQGRRDRPRAADDRPRAAQDRQLSRAPTGSGAASGPAASCATSARIRSSSSCSSPARRRPRSWRATSPISIIPKTPEFEDFGQILLASDDATGFIRVDWFTQDGLAVWGDGRLFIMGTEGTIELRKYIDIAGRPGGDHLFIVDRKGTRHVDCAGDEDRLRRAASRRRAEPHRDGHEAEPLLLRHRAGADGAGEGDADRRQAPAGARGMSAPLKVGVVGAGVGVSHIEAYRELGALYSRRGALRHRCRAREEGRRQSSASRRSSPISTRCLKLDLDIVDICTPSALHFAQARKALLAGHHVVVEKPFASSLAEADALAELERKSGKRVSPIFQYRFANGIAQLLHLRERRVSPARPTPRRSRRIGGGCRPTTPIRGAGAGRRSSAAASPRTRSTTTTF